MAYSFRKILVPVDFSINTEVAIKKALDLADSHAHIHLLHVDTLNRPGRSVSRHVEATNELFGDKPILQKLAHWKTNIIKTRNDLQVYTWVSRNHSVQDTIERKAIATSCDLIVIGKQSHHHLLPLLNTVTPSQLAKQTGIGVLTVKPGALNNTVQTILVPIASETIHHKLEVVAAICRKFTVNIHLVTFINNENEPLDFYASSLLKAYRWLKTKTNCSVEYFVLHGENKAKALLQYAEKANADILLVDPETETKINWMNARLSDLLPASSKVEVLAVRPTT